MAANRPYPDELFQTLSDWLSRLADGYKPSVYEARMARHALAILRREAALGARTKQAEIEGLQSLLNSSENDISTLNQHLVQALREGSILADDPQLLSHLRASVDARLRIDNPAFNKPHNK